MLNNPYKNATIITYICQVLELVKIYRQKQITNRKIEYNASTPTNGKYTHHAQWKPAAKL